MWENYSVPNIARSHAALSTLPNLILCQKCLSVGAFLVRREEQFVFVIYPIWICLLTDPCTESCLVIPSVGVFTRVKYVLRLRGHGSGAHKSYVQWVEATPSKVCRWLSAPDGPMLRATNKST